MKQFSSVTKISNGGLEQGILEAVKETQGLTENEEARLNHLKSLPQNRTEVRNTYHVMEKKDMGTDAKTRFARYLLNLGYKVVEGTIQESRAGVSAQVHKSGKPDASNFTQIQAINPIKWYVRLSVQDYYNNDITEGKF